MKAVNFFKLAVAAALVIGIGFLIPTDSGAATSSIGSTVSIVAAVTITDEADQVWGIMVVPSGADDVWIMDPCNAALTGAHDNANNPLVDENTGSFQINGTGTLTVNFGATMGANFTGTNAPVLSDPTVCPTSGSAPLDAGVFVVGVGSTLTVASTTAAGDYVATINVSANY